MFHGSLSELQDHSHLQITSPARGEYVLDIVLTSQEEFVDNVTICESLGCSDHNQIHFIIKVKGERNRKIWYRIFSNKGHEEVFST